MKRFYIFAIAALAMAACTNDGSEQIIPTVQNDNVIRLNSSIGSLTRASDGLLETSFVSGTKVKVKPTDNATSGPIASYEWVEYTVASGGALTPSTTQYFPASGSSINISAYYPSTASTETNGFVVALDQAGSSADDAYKAADLMYATVTGITKQSSTPTLEFNHKMSKIKVSLLAGTGIQTTEINAATVTLKDVIYKGTFVPATGNFTASNETGDKGDVIIARNAGTTAHSAIVIPQDVAGKIIEVTIGSTAKEYTIPTSTEFEAGKVYAYTITLNATGISVQSSIANWNNGTGGSGSVTF